MNKFMQFLLKVDKSIMKHLSPWWKERGATAMITVPVAHGNTGAKEKWREHAKDSGVQIERGTGLLPGILVTTPGRRQRAARSSRKLQCSRSRHRRWRLAPGLQRVVATIRYRKGEKGEQSNREYSSKVLASKELHYISMHWYQME